MISILSSKQKSSQQDVNYIGKWLYKNIDSASSFKKLSNMSEVEITILYEIPKELVELYELDESYAGLREMKITLNLTTYQDKIRFNIIENSPEEVTLGCCVYNLVSMEELQTLKQRVLNYLDKRLSKRYEGFEFIF